ncbi:MAG: hypothetical protein GWP48_06850, partial [Actinobacteria bacterium]|nr:hypothetical protein [Actinomycetota bacterium]
TTSAPPTTTTEAPTAATAVDFTDKSKKNQDKAKIELNFDDSSGNDIEDLVVTVRFTYADGTFEETTVDTDHNGKITVTRLSMTSGMWDVAATIVSAEKDGVSYIPDDAGPFTLD